MEKARWNSKQHHGQLSRKVKMKLSWHGNGKIKHGNLLVFWADMGAFMRYEIWSHSNGVWKPILGIIVP
jgi:hypothetical protein